MFTIRGKKVILRRKRLEDAWNDYHWKRDPELAYLDATAPLNLPYSVYLASYSEELRYTDPTEHRYAIDTLEGKHIGNCSCYNMDTFKGEAELGILIGDRDYWDKGYGSDAVATLLDYVFQKNNLKRVYLHTLEDNVRAQKCFQKCGFVPCGSVIRGNHRFIRMDITREGVTSVAKGTSSEG
ncbi:MAG: N-acetyltransferase [Chloroflexi bacterium]|nr:MAG: N-acetyltransferase [Chloroflexota bacterium]RLC96894.1 MAG: N-acetyltransferase [Chloroflexota bacterium]